MLLLIAYIFPKLPDLTSGEYLKEELYDFLKGVEDFF